MVPVGHAGDGGGSIRIPASMCGLFGLKPTRGRVSLGPAEHEAWAGLVMRHVVTRTVRDSAAVLDVLQGYMTGDWYTAPPPARAYADEVGADAGQAAHRRAHDRAARARDRRSRVRRRGRGRGAAARVARPHRRRGRARRARRRRAARDVHHGDALVAARRAGRSRGRSSAAPVTADDMEPATWASYEAGAGDRRRAATSRALKKMQAWARAR